MPAQQSTPSRCPSKRDRLPGLLRGGLNGCWATPPTRDGCPGCCGPGCPGRLCMSWGNKFEGWPGWCGLTSMPRGNGVPACLRMSVHRHGWAFSTCSRSSARELGVHESVVRGKLQGGEHLRAGVRPAGAHAHAQMSSPGGGHAVGMRLAAGGPSLEARLGGAAGRGAPPPPWPHRVHICAAAGVVPLRSAAR